MRFYKRCLLQFIKTVIPVRATNSQLIRPQAYINQIDTTNFPFMYTDKPLVL